MSDRAKKNGKLVKAWDKMYIFLFTHINFLINLAEELSFRLK